MSSTGFIPSEPRYPKSRDTVSSSSLPLPPDEVLFRSRGAPQRYEEDDIYWADRDLGPDRTLPESDLLKAVHTHASYFYGRSTQQGGAVDFESLDETALLCMGILLEETADHVLGETGDMAFVEGEFEEGEEVKVASGDPSSQGSTNHDASTIQDSAGFSEQTTNSEEPRKRKRRKVKPSEKHSMPDQQRRRMKRDKQRRGPPEIKISN